VAPGPASETRTSEVVDTRVISQRCRRRPFGHSCPARRAAIGVAVYSQSGSSFRMPIDLRCCAPVERRRLCGELEPWFAEAGLMLKEAHDETGRFVPAHRA
jgi:hypothetical protein